ncbi:MAG: YicC/YloC family endoribonuclease [Thermoguttaceae bacterium]
MLLSMSGFGDATCQEEAVSITVEIKSVNNRYFKLALRMTEGFPLLEARIETLIRSAIERGTVNATIRIRRERKESDYRINPDVIKSYFQQLVNVNQELGLESRFVFDTRPRLDRLVMLPGVVEIKTAEPNTESELLWKVLEKAVKQALERLLEMRRAEGESMRIDLATNIEKMETLIAAIERCAPKVAASYRDKLLERVGGLLTEQGMAIQEADLIREVALFADRVDVSEETVRFRSHLEQFAQTMQSPEQVGRKLDFLTQELLRETNTIGSKANDAEITRHVVEIKTHIERIREMVQNIE